MDSVKPKSKRGFASMSPEQQKKIASMGGKAAHASGHAHEFTSEEAAAAGRRGGAAKHKKKPPSPQLLDLFGSASGADYYA